mmetsp:Transcript_39801/g.73385  ORF Transcript_39801/g.73385 Transcript_39801/m.73385 type:complete len:301 (+) Transcript_39801:263-1165(+)
MTGVHCLLLSRGTMRPLKAAAQERRARPPTFRGIAPRPGRRRRRCPCPGLAPARGIRPTPLLRRLRPTTATADLLLLRIITRATAIPLLRRRRGDPRRPSLLQAPGAARAETGAEALHHTLTSTTNAVAEESTMTATIAAAPLRLPTTATTLRAGEDGDPRRRTRPLRPNRPARRRPPRKAEKEKGPLTPPRRPSSSSLQGRRRATLLRLMAGRTLRRRTSTTITSTRLRPIRLTTWVDILLTLLPTTAILLLRLDTARRTTTTTAEAILLLLRLSSNSSRPPSLVSSPLRPRPPRGTRA